MALRIPVVVVSSFLSLAIVLTSEAAPPVRQSGTPTERVNLGPNFSHQLRKVFGRFRHADLQQVFESAQPSQCADLVSDNGEWREVGFFNENRSMGNWFHTSIEEIRSKLDVYIFTGTCTRPESPISVTTRFPVDPSLKAYERGELHLSEVQVKVNTPVVASFERETRAYTFDLPYLFRVSDINSPPLYALNPPSLSDRYAPDVINRWECKTVIGEDLTYRFLICRTSLFLRNASRSTRNAKSAYGQSAFSILSDGQEASSSVNLTFGAVSDPR